MTELTAPGLGPATVTVDVESPDDTRDVGERLAHLLRAGDLVMLSGGLGAGKTTLTQGIGRGLGVRGQVSSPTFIVARVHRGQNGGPALIHADAYRITDLDDLETLDLDSSLDEAVTVVEWGEGKTESLSDNRLEVNVHRETGGSASTTGSVVDLSDMDDGHRTITITGYGPRWAELADQWGKAEQP